MLIKRSFTVATQWIHTGVCITINMEVIIALLGLMCLCHEIRSDRSFQIDYSNDRFLKDGVPYRYIQGTLDYFRVPRGYWQDRMEKMKAAGLTGIQTNVPWNLHQPQPNEFVFENDLDIVAFLTLANDTGLEVVLNVGPYIGDYLDFGGLPYWLLRENPDVKVRTTDPGFLNFVESWIKKLSNVVQPFLFYNNYGPIIAFQVENNYGSFSCDENYKDSLGNMFTDNFGSDLVYFTVDVASTADLSCGHFSIAYSTIDLTPDNNAEMSFDSQREVESHGPLVSNAYDVGHADKWGSSHAAIDADQAAATLNSILRMDASVNLRYFHGGTNFGYTALGCTSCESYTTSLDYFAPISECGDITEQYYQYQSVISKYSNDTYEPAPNNPKHAYGTVRLTAVGSIFEILPELLPTPPVYAEEPLTFEALGQHSGFVLYETLITEFFNQPTTLNVSGIRDRAYVFVDQSPVGILNQAEGITSLDISISPDQVLYILAENEGRPNPLDSTADTSIYLKGITANIVTLGGLALRNWKMSSIPLNQTRNLATTFEGRGPSLKEYEKNVPVIYFGELLLPVLSAEPVDTFLNPETWTRGLAIINDVNLGKYWPQKGPQVTLYVPKDVLNPYPLANNIILLELEQAPDTGYIEFTDHPILDGSATEQHKN